MTRVLVACEFSGIVRDAFIACGHDAISVDLLPSERPGPHIVGDALEAIHTVQPRLLIAHPPCQYLSNSGVRWLYGGKGDVRDETRWARMNDAAAFFAALIMADVPRIAVENPIMHSHGQLAIQAAAIAYGYPEKGWDAITSIQPWQFGTPETKQTRLWLRNLPPLVPTNIVDGRTPRVHFASPGPDRWKERSRTDVNIAAAMAEQWGSL